MKYILKEVQMDVQLPMRKVRLPKILPKVLRWGLKIMTVVKKGKVDVVDDSSAVETKAVVLDFDVF